MGKFDIIQWTKKSTTSLRDKQPVTACFGLYPKVYSTHKLIYKAVVVGEDIETPEVGVLKARRYRPGTERFWQSELDLNRYAHQLATAFTNQTLAGRIEMVDQYIAPIHRHKTWDKMCLKMKPKYFRQLTKFEMVLVEEVVRDLKAFKNDKVLEAFSHYSYSESNGENLLYAFRGNRTKEGRYLLLTPEMLTHKYDIHKWFQKHTCNEICGRFRRPPESNYPDLKPSNTDIQSDKSFYNFKNDLQPPNYYDEMPRDSPNAPNAPNAPHDTAPPKQNNLETTFGTKSCDGSQSVVTAVVHSDNIGKNKRPMAPEKEAPTRKQDKAVRETAISNETYNLIPVPIDSPEEDEITDNTARSNVPIDTFQDVPFEKEIMPKSENRPKTNDPPSKMNDDVIVDASTLVARPSSMDYDAPKEIDIDNVTVVGVDEEDQKSTPPDGVDELDGPDYANTPDSYQTMIIHHDRDKPIISETNSEQFQNAPNSCEYGTEERQRTKSPEETEKQQNIELPVDETNVVNCDEIPPPTLEIRDEELDTDEEKRNDEEFTIEVASPVYININDLGTFDSSRENGPSVAKYTQPVAEVVPSPVLMSPPFKEPKNENNFTNATEESPQAVEMTSERLKTPPDSGLIDNPGFTLETFTKQFVLPNKPVNDISNEYQEQTNKVLDDSPEQLRVIAVNERCDESIGQENDNDKIIVMPVIVINNASDENDDVNQDDVDSSYASNSDSLDDSQDALVLDEKGKIKETNIDEVISPKESDPNPTENLVDENKDFLAKYNLQDFVDTGDNGVNSQTYKITDYKLISDYIQILPEETEPQDSLSSQQQRPLHSSLKSGKHKEKGRSVKFVDDLHDDKYIRFYKRKDVVNSLNTSPYNQINVVVELHPEPNSNPTNAPMSHDTSGDPNWFSAIPCECCIDNDSSTGRD